MAGAVTWNQPSQLDRNYALAGYDRPHMLQIGFVYELPFARRSRKLAAAVVKNWQVNGIASWLSGDAVHDRRRQRPAAAAGRPADDQRDRRAEARVSARPGPDEQWYDPSHLLAAGQRLGQHRSQRRSARRRTGTWTSRCSARSRFGRYRLSSSAPSPQNVFNHTQWGDPVTGFTDPNFMRIRTLARAPRTVQLGTRLVF